MSDREREKKIIIILVYDPIIRLKRNTEKVTEMEREREIERTKRKSVFFM